ncbi:MAG TPA: SGNH/GDSL hydrolase family protein [candidate division Zixibacteria bacterium]|nr:SGNH/GDSL hydrolase family protein [candidate division Zixibacteria bacterium]
MSQGNFNLGRKFVYSLLVFFALLLISEVGLKLAGNESRVTNRFFVLNRALDYPEVFARDHDLFWRLRPNRTVTSEFFEGKTYRINSRGLRGPEPTTEKTLPRLMAVGNSCTFGWGVGDSATYIARAGHYLDGRYEVINAGVPGYSSLQGCRFFERNLKDIRADIVFVMFGWNDQWAAAGGIADKDQKLPPEWILSLQNGLNRFGTYRVIRKIWLEAIEPNVDSLFDRDHIVYRVGIDESIRNVVQLCKAIKENGGMPVILTQPQPNLTDHPEAAPWAHPINYHKQLNNRLRQESAWLSIPMIDITAGFDEHPEFYDNPAEDFIHFNAAGHDYIGRRLAQFVSEEI